MAQPIRMRPPPIDPVFDIPVRRDAPRGHALASTMSRKRTPDVGPCPPPLSSRRRPGSSGGNPGGCRSPRPCILTFAGILWDWMPAFAGMTLDGIPRRGTWHADIHPTDALGARRDEEGGLSHNPLPIPVIPAKAGIQWWKRWRMLSFRPWIPASAGMTLDWMHRHHHRMGRRQAGTSASARPTRSARAATKSAEATSPTPWPRGVGVLAPAATCGTWLRGRKILILWRFRQRLARRLLRHLHLPPCR